MAPRKVRLIVDTIRGKSALDAETRLSFMKQAAAEPVLKLLRSAMANASHNFHMEKGDLMIKSIVADGGPMLKRSRPRAFGRSAPIRKRTTHITIVLISRKETQPEAAPGKSIRKELRRTPSVSVNHLNPAGSHTNT